MRKIENKVMLITYADSLGHNMKELKHVVDTYMEGAVEGIHILPFFPASGDRGFAVISYDNPDPNFGTWEDFDAMGEKYTMAADFMLNHASIRSEEFQDYMEKGEDSKYKNMFIDWNKFWPNGEPTEEDMKVMYIRKGSGPVKSFTRKDGKVVNIWNTFGPEQMDINPYDAATQEYYDKALGIIAKHVPLVRFDAFAYASKCPGTSCFFVEPEVWEVLDIAMAPLKKAGCQMLAEIHENYHIQLKMAEKGYYVYDFALPMLMIHGILFGRTDRLRNWLHMAPRNQYTTLDTHDGIGVVDVAGLLTEEEVDATCEVVEERNKEAYALMPQRLNIKRSDGKKTRYQMAGTFYTAMGLDDNAYLIARAVQFFTPGIPQVYYVGALAGYNDIEYLREHPMDGRGVNRHNYTIEEVAQEVERPVVKKLLNMMRFRNEYSVFDGEFIVDDSTEENKLHLTWKDNGLQAELFSDFKEKTFEIKYLDPKTGETKTLEL